MLVILSTLLISDADRRWIEEFRRLHDPQHGLVEAHFTLVFPFEGLEQDDVISHARIMAKRTPPIAFRLSRAEAVRDVLAPRSHVFLLPIEGAAGVRELHGRLYKGPLARFDRPDIPYVPHVTIAAFAEHKVAQELADELMPLDIAGHLVDLRVAMLGGGKLKELETIPLG